MLNLKAISVLKRAFEPAFFALSLAYPFALYFYANLSQIALFMAILWAVKAFFEGASARKGLNFKALSSLFIAAFFGVTAFLRLELLAYFYPVLMNLVFLTLFAVSLKGEALITQMARLKEKDLSVAAVLYTRRLTLLWCGFFALNALISALLALLEDKSLWLFYTGVLSYALTALFIGAELIFRKLVLQKRLSHV